MKAALIALAMLSSSAFAHWTPILDTTSLTCQQAREMVRRNGFQHFTVNGEPKLPQYVTYYYDKSAEGGFLQAVQAWVPTKDASNCPVGYILVPKPVNGGLTGN